MSSRRAYALTAATLLYAGASQLAPAQSASNPQPTIGDLTKRKVDVHKDTAAAGNSTRAMENYQRFLQLQNTDPKLRAEAMRRLGDLNLDDGEMERMEKEVTTVD